MQNKMEDTLMILGGGVLFIFIGVMVLKSYGNSKNKKMICSSCGREISITATVCPYCHRRVGSRGIFDKNFQKQDAHNQKIWVGLVFVFMGVMFIAEGLGFNIW